MKRKKWKRKRGKETWSDDVEKKNYFFIIIIEQFLPSSSFHLFFIFI